MNTYQLDNFDSSYYTDPELTYAFMPLEEYDADAEYLDTIAALNFDEEF